MAERSEAEREYGKLDDKRTRRKEAIKMSFESVKQFATLSSGAIVLIGTFSNSIFPTNSDGTLNLSIGVKLLLTGSFVLFGVTLVLSIFFMLVHINEIGKPAAWDLEYGDGPQDPVSYSPIELGWYSGGAMAFWTFALGFLCFGLAALLSLL